MCEEQSKSKAEAKQSTIESKGNSPEKIKAKAKAKQSNAMEGNSLGTCFLPMCVCAQRKSCTQLQPSHMLPRGARVTCYPAQSKATQGQGKQS